MSARAVRLTDSGLELLKSALDACWQTNFPGVRQTREARAEFFQMSIATTQKLLDGKPVDKSTIMLAFQRLGVPWDDGFCVRSGMRPDAPTIEAPQPHLLTEKERAPDRHPAMWLGSALTLVGLWTVAIATSAKSPKTAIVEPWRYELNQLLNEGTKEYQKGHYDQAQRKIEASLAIARQQDVAGACAENLRILGDIASAKGDLNGGRNYYLDALEIRQKSVKLNAGTNQPSLENTIPPLMEALGNVETRLKMWNEAREHFLVALRKYKEQNVPAGVAMAYRGLGTLTYKRGLFAESLTHFRSAFKSLEHKDIGSDLAFDIKARQALSLAELGQADMATDVLFACLRHWETSGHIRWQAETKLQLGVVALRRRRPDEASRYLTASLAEFQKVGDAENARHARELLANTRN